MVKKGSFFRRIFGKGASGKGTAEKTAEKTKGRRPPTEAAGSAKSAGAAKAATAMKPEASRTSTATKPRQTPPAGPINEKQVKPPVNRVKDVSVAAEILQSDEKVNDEGASEFKVITKKLSEQEEASVKISQGLKGLSSVLGDIDERLKENTRTGNELVSTVNTIPEMLKDLPESSRAGLELLNSISQIMDNQSRDVEALGGKVTDFSKVVNDLGSKIEKDARSRTSDVKTFERSIGGVRESVTGLSEQQTKSNERQAGEIKSLARALKKTNEMQDERISSVAGRMKVMNWLVVILMLVIVAGIVAVVVKLG
jgi:hypothetical protein